MTRLSDDSFTGTIEPVWAMGRAVFGGYQGAAAAVAVRHLTDTPVCGVVVDFIEPLTTGDYDVRAQLLKRGRALERYKVELYQDNRLCSIALVSCASPRETIVRPVTTPAPSIRPLHDLEEVVPADFGGPEFTRNYVFAFDDGRPFSGASEAHILGWVKTKSHAVYDVVDIIAMTDAFPPPTLATVDQIFPGGTVTWISTIHDILDLSGWLIYDGKTTWAKDGLLEFSATIHAPDGRLVASTRQLNVEFSDRLAR